MTETLPESLVSGSGSDAVPYAPLDDGSGDPLFERRSFERLSAPAARPVRLHFQASPLAPSPEPEHWADLIDLSLGGACLVVEDLAGLELNQTLLLDFSIHQPAPASPVASPIQAQLRWLSRSGPIITLGVEFSPPLAQLPVLKMA